MLRLVGTMAKIWFFQNWMYAGLIAGLFLLAVLPLVAGEWSAAMVAVFLMLPAYMVHQAEEHAGDRFRRFVNKHIAKVPNALTTSAVVVVNVPLVWGVDLVAIYLARFVAIGWGLIAIYLILVNAVLHVVGAAAFRAYNPGLVTAVRRLPAARHLGPRRGRRRPGRDRDPARRGARLRRRGPRCPCGLGAPPGTRASRRGRLKRPQKDANGRAFASALQTGKKPQDFF